MKKAKKHRPRVATAVDDYIGATMRQRRIAVRLSQATVGERPGISFQQVQKYEAGKNRLSAARLFEICEILDVSLVSTFERSCSVGETAPGS